MWFIKLCIERPVFVVMMESLLLILGVLGFQRIGIDLYPKIDPPTITIKTEYPGAGPEEIETLISKKIEESVNQLGGIKRIVSTSQQNISNVVVEFQLEVNAQSAQNDVRDKVMQVRNDLPADIEEPVIERLNFEDRPIVRVALSAETPAAEKTYSGALLRIIADDQIKPQLQKADGVGQINLFGGREREVQVLVDRVKLQTLNIGMPDIQQAIIRGNANTPSGEIDEQPSRRSVRVLGEFAGVKEMENVIIKTLPSGRVIKLSDVAKVDDGLSDQTSLARLNGRPVVILEVKKQSDANTVAVADRIVKQVGLINPTLPEGLKLTEIYDGSQFIKASVHDVIETIVIAGILAIVVVYFFLGSLQSTLITGLALPCTVIASFFVLNTMNFTLNIMTLLGLTLSVGLILDDAIVIRENIWNKIEQGLDAKKASLEGTREVLVAVLATSLTVLAVFFPVTFIPGIVGRFFAAFALTVCIGIILSTFDAVTMAPMLSANLMRAGGGGHGGGHGQRNRVLNYLEGIGERVSQVYERWLRRSLKRPWLTIVMSVGILFSSLFLLKYVGFTFLPDDESGEIDVKLEALPGTSFHKMQEIALTTEKLIKETVPEATIISTKIGNEFAETNIAIIFVKLVPYGDRDRTTSAVKNAIRLRLRPLGESERVLVGIGNAGSSNGGRPVSMVVQGADNKTLQQLAQKIIDGATQKVAGVANLETNLKPGRQELQLVIDRQNASAFGLRSRDIGENVRGLYEGLKAGVYRENGEEYDIRVRLRDDQRADTMALAGLTIPNERGDAVPLSSVVHVQNDASPTSIVRIDQRRSARIEGDLIPGAPLAKVVEDLANLIKPMLPPGYTLNFQGQAESLADLRAGAVGALFLGAIFIYMVMASLYESFVMPLAILMTLPLAIIGAILSLLVSAKLLDIYGIIGVILLMALVTKNAILLVDYAEHLRREGMPRHEALMEAGLRRMRPIVMTTIAMIAGMIPVAIGYGEVNKARAGMGITTIGGLISSTILSLLVIPCVYIYLDNLRNWGSRMIKRYYFRDEVKAVVPTEHEGAGILLETKDGIPSP